MREIFVKGNSIYGSRKVSLDIIYRLIEEGKVEIDITSEDGNQKITYKFKEMGTTKVTWQRFVESKLGEKGLKRKDLAKALFIHQQNINSKVYNNPTLRTMKAVCTFLGEPLIISNYLITE